MVYIQSNLAKTLPHHFDCSCALFGATDNALDFKLVTYEELTLGKYDALLQNYLFVGSTEFMMEIFRRLGLENVGVPENTNRFYETITLEQAWDRAAADEKIFIKPLQIKLFTGFVLDKMQYGCLNGLSRETLVMAYKPFEHKIVSEWRLYIHNHQIVDSRNYSGDFKISPSYVQATKIVDKQRQSWPKAYTMDVGILENGEDVIIEYNDMWAIGNYGIPNDIYVRMLQDRYFQIVR